ncbi:hypothetical protein LOY64_22735 [Pseudomonas corrugata]|uniref:hypothetical protein n=1 Tax=Pseudomonas corrugata TaxID=47879 RepID=UPI00222F6808|nr:hypothetical protein [Pseudomonas corrugata]UZD94097.1 hypothetical protein LOY64_22735 [Pseudomonas corrugata]
MSDEMILPDLPSLPPSAVTQESTEELLPPVMEFPNPDPNPLPEASAVSSAVPVQTAVLPQTQKSSRVRSATLNALQDEPPATVCARCPHAIWQQVPEGDVRVYCLVMHSLIDKVLVECDGRFLVPK